MHFAELTEQAYPPPFCTVASYEVAGKTRLNLPFQCHVGHKFMAGAAEVALGDCPTCNIEREYALAGQTGVRVIGGLYWNPNCMLRACCTICFNEFYISPQEMSGGCGTRHKSVNPRIKHMNDAIRVLETIFNTRFDDMPKDPALRCDAYSAKYKFGIVAFDNPYSNEHYDQKQALINGIVSDKYGSMLYRMNVPPAASIRDVAIEIVNTVLTHVSGFKSCQSDTKLQFIGELLKIMDALANANRDYPTRGLVRDLAAATPTH